MDTLSPLTLVVWHVIAAMEIQENNIKKTGNTREKIERKKEREREKNYCHCS